MDMNLLQKIHIKGIIKDGVKFVLVTDINKLVNPYYYNDRTTKR